MEELTQEQLFAMKSNARAAKDEKYCQDSKIRLEKIITTKLKTSFIGALDAFEQAFGDMWGCNQEESLTPTQLANKDAWEIVRNKILTNGNNQIRAVHTELELYTVKWNRYYVNLPMIGAK